MTQITNGSAASHAAGNNLQARFASRVKAKLSRPSLTPEEARDGIIDCFAATYHRGMAAGFETTIGLKGEDEDIHKVVAALFRKKLQAHGASFEKPTVQALATTKGEADAELHFTGLSTEIRSGHDHVCALLLEKTKVLPPKPAEEAKMTPPPTPVSAPQVQAVSAPITTPAATPPSMPVVAEATQVAAPSARVSDNLRAALSAHLGNFSRGVSLGDGQEAMRGYLVRIEKLMALIAEFENDPQPTE